MYFFFFIFKPSCVWVTVDFCNDKHIWFCPLDLEPVYLPSQLKCCIFSHRFAVCQDHVFSDSHFFWG